MSTTHLALRGVPSPHHPLHPGGNSGANVKSISQTCYRFEVAFVWELTKETIGLPLGCLQGGFPRRNPPTHPPERPASASLCRSVFGAERSFRTCLSRWTHLGEGASASRTCKRPCTRRSTLEVSHGQILSQSPTDATRFWWHLYGS